MRKLPFSYQFALAPALIIVMLSALIGFAFYQLAIIRHENEVVRQWIRITDRLHLALDAGRRIVDIANDMTSASRAKLEQLRTSFAEQAEVFTGNALYPEVLYRLPAATRHELEATRVPLSGTHPMDPASVKALLAPLLPQIEALYNAAWSEKRRAYAGYYRNLTTILSDVLTVSLSTLIACVVTALLLSGWSLRSIKKRMRALAAHARSICDGELVAAPPPSDIRDELDQLAQCLSRMTQRLIHVVSVEKVIQGAEDERRRIAMDMHDQVLADLTALLRKTERLEHLDYAADSIATGNQIAELKTGIDEAIHSIRQVIEDLHPQALDILGLEAALRSFLEYHVKGVHSPHYTLQFDPIAEGHLAQTQRVNVFRMLIEAVHNVLRHAQCTQFEISVHTSGNTLIARLDDNGIGMQGKTEAGVHGHGLINIRERAKTIGAKVGWSASRFASGTCVEIRLPIAEAAPAQVSWSALCPTSSR